MAAAPPLRLHIGCWCLWLLGSVGMATGTGQTVVPVAAGGHRLEAVSNSEWPNLYPTPASSCALCSCSRGSGGDAGTEGHLVATWDGRRTGLSHSVQGR